jgi:hypothetical protein
MTSRSRAIYLWLCLLGCRSEAGTDCLPDAAQPCVCGQGPVGRRACASDGFAECACDAAGMIDAGAEAGLVDASMPDAPSEVALADADAFQPAQSDAGVASDASCGTQTSVATLRETRAVDVIFVIDNSGSMSNEIAGVEANINDNFARIVDQTGADYRVIMLSHHGSSQSQQICIKAPLSGTSCNPIPTEPANGPRFFHYDQDVQSTDSWCWVLDTFDRPDQHNLARTGWQAWLRPSALKVFVEVTDDGIGCSSRTLRGSFTDPRSMDPVADAIALAKAFNDALLLLSPAQFGTKQKPNYVWHSVIGVKANTPAELPWSPTDAFQTGICNSASNAGGGYQMLSTSSGGLRYPVCEGNGFETIFRAIAREVVQGAGIDCRFPIPAAPVGKFVDKSSITVAYSAQGTQPPERLARVEPSACGERAFVIEEQQVVLCDQACARVRLDKSAKLQVVYGCGSPMVD